MNSAITPNTFETSLQSAHLMILRGEYRDARMLLNELAIRFPGNADVAELLQEVNKHDTPPPLRSAASLDFLTKPINTNLTRNSASLILLGIFSFILGLLHGIPAVQAAIANGIGGTMWVQGKYLNHFHREPIKAQLLTSACLMVVSAISLSAARWQIRRRSTNKP